MRIVIDLQSCQNGSRTRGIGRYAMNLTKELIVSGKEHEFLIFLTDRFPGSVDYVRKELLDFLPQSSIYVCSLPSGVAAAGLENAWRTRAAELLRTAFISRLEPDILFIPSPLEGLWDDAIVSIDSVPYPVAVTVHDLIPLDDLKRYLPAQNDQDAFFRRIHTIKRADLLIAISDFVARTIETHIGIESEKIITAFNGIDEKQFFPPIPSSSGNIPLLKRLGISKPFVLNTSPLEYRKNIEGLIAAFGSMSQQVRKGHQLVIVGKMDAYARSYLAGLIQAEGLQVDTLVLTDFVSDEDLITLYAACSIFAFPAWSEGFGLPPLEAMACGAPVISANTTSLPEVVGRKDMLVDPSSPSQFGQAMERVLTNPAIQQDLRSYGIERARTFTWSRTAQTVLSAFEKIHTQSRTNQLTQTTTNLPKRPKIAFVCAQMDRNNDVAGRLSGLIAALTAKCDITLFTDVAGDQLDQWTSAQTEYQPLGSLDWTASQFDRIIYAGNCAAVPVLSDIISNYPGLYIEIRPLESTKYLGERGSTLTSSMQRDIIASHGVSGLITVSEVPNKMSQWQNVAGSSLSMAALQTLREGNGGLPLLPLAADTHAAAHYRHVMQVPDNAPLVSVIVSRNETVNSFLSAFRDMPDIISNARMVIHVIDEKTITPNFQNPILLQGGIHRFSGKLTPLYRGLVSAANLILLGSDLPKDLIERCLSDARGLQRTTIEASDTYKDLTCKIFNTLTLFHTNRAYPTDPSMLPSSQPINIWMDGIMDALKTEPRPKLASQLFCVTKTLPGSVRRLRPDSLDLGAVSIALSRNEAIERPPLIFIDVTAYAAPGSIRRLDSVTRQQLIALLQRGKEKVSVVYDAGGHLLIAHQFVGRLAGVRNFYLADEPLVTRPGDRIIGLDFLYSTFQPVTAWKESLIFGASALYFAAGAIAVRGGYEDTLASLILQWAQEATPGRSSSLIVPEQQWENKVSNIQLADLLASQAINEMPISVFSLEGYPTQIKIQNQPNNLLVKKASSAMSESIDTLNQKVFTVSNPNHSMQYTVMGHLIGSYSLAIINRAVATTLEQSYPHQTHFLPFETDPITHTNGVPTDEKQLMTELCLRPQPDPSQEVIISQHWPVMPPTSHPRLALSLFAWEETRVPSNIIDTFTNGFDAIISPAQCVTDALSLSGCRLPIATIGQPVELASLRTIARQRKAITQPARRFLHVSSCFPRKGVDVLLTAWAKAFVKEDNVELIIKTFPNPHNEVSEQLTALNKKYPKMASVQIINRDMQSEELFELYKMADAMVLPTRGEGYNLPALESMIAGLPLIVTGHGGQRDFCGPLQARMIRFTFARSNSHVTDSHSLWVEPDIDDLISALREYADPVNISQIEQRRQAALAASKVENDNQAWARRFSSAVHDLLQPQNLTIPKVGWVSTWNINCGIAQYSKYLIDHMSTEQQQNIVVFSDHRSEEKNDSITFSPIWNNVRDIPQDIVVAALEQGVEALVIQHQDGLISWSDLADLSHDERLFNITTIVILHNARGLQKVGTLELKHIVLGLGKMSRILVHNIDDMNYLVSLGIQCNLGLLPHGAFAPRQIPWPRTLSPTDAPIIACHGFFFPHKGIDKLIRAAAKLRRKWPKLKLRLVNARFPGNEHDRIIQDCRDLTEKLGLKDTIEWHLDFLPVAEVEELLGGADLIVLPYDESGDSASGAVRTALTTMIPLVATRVKIFDELDGAVTWTENNDPDELAKTITTLLENPEKRRSIQAGMHDWLKAHDWRHIATGLENMVYGLVRQQRLGWQEPRNRFNDLE